MLRILNKTFQIIPTYLNTGPCELGHVDVYPLSLRAGDVLPAPGERLVAVETLAKYLLSKYAHIFIS